MIGLSATSQELLPRLRLPPGLCPLNGHYPDDRADVIASDKSATCFPLVLKLVVPVVHLWGRIAFWIVEWIRICEKLLGL